VLISSPLYDMPGRFFKTLTRTSRLQQSGNLSAFGGSRFIGEPK
jgi:hypothetical protein